MLLKSLTVPNSLINQYLNWQDSQSLGSQSTAKTSTTPSRVPPSSPFPGDGMSPSHHPHGVAATAVPGTR